MSHPITRRELIRRFRKLGFDGPRVGGRHEFMQRGPLKVRIPNPHGEAIDGSLVREILRQASIPVKDWEKV